MNKKKNIGILFKIEGVKHQIQNQNSDVPAQAMPCLKCPLIFPNNHKDFHKEKPINN